MEVVLAIMVALLTVALALLAILGNMDAPTVRGEPVWPILLIGFVIAAALAFSHFHSI